MPESKHQRLVTLDFGFGDVVYLRVRRDKVPGMIVSIELRPCGMSYCVTWGNEGHALSHYAFELTAEYLPDYDTT